MFIYDYCGGGKMKYEIIKGSEKDFEGAPEWCTHVSKSCESGERAWEMADVVVIGNKYKWARFQEPEMEYVHSSGLELNIIAERRPITEPELKPIYGDGIHDDSEALQQRIIIGEQGKLSNIGKPLQVNTITEPVVWLNPDECDGSEYLGSVIGKEMECHAKDGSIFVVVVVAFDGDLPIVKTRLHGNYFGCDPSQLKPIRSPEYVARDEAIANICFEIGVRSENVVVQQTYDAIAAGKVPGITKTPTVSELMRVDENATREDCEAIVKLLSGN